MDRHAEHEIGALGRAAASSTAVSGLEAPPRRRARTRAPAAIALAGPSTGLHVERDAVPAGRARRTRSGAPGASTIRWQSSAAPHACTSGAIDATTTGPMVISGMKWPSPASKWKTLAPASTSAPSCSPRREKSAA